MDLYSIIMKIFSFRGITQRHLWKKIPHYWIFFPEMTLGYSPELTHSKNWKLMARIMLPGFFFPEMTLSNSPIWVWIFFPKMTLGHSPEKSYNFSLNLDIFYWWRHMYDVITYIGSVGDGASISHDVTWWLLCVTS